MRLKGGGSPQVQGVQCHSLPNVQNVSCWSSVPFIIVISALPDHPLMEYQYTFPCSDSPNALKALHHGNLDLIKVAPLHQKWWLSLNALLDRFRFPTHTSEMLLTAFTLESITLNRRRIFFIFVCV
ncbi:unnamed protein product [Albugo candida]|uniref:Uncharacterized protein n=1 Tax=Albugo candida TaxID=65357 RepID=A0A024GS07_9STRA|nr:unnamed protein product [Albugo candida]|eukprot:CCI49487.1 unnamed protein product [Albugo candida]